MANNEPVFCISLTIFFSSLSILAHSSYTVFMCSLGTTTTPSGSPTTKSPGFTVTPPHETGIFLATTLYFPPPVAGVVPFENTGYFFVIISQESRVALLVIVPPNFFCIAPSVRRPPHADAFSPAS